MKRYNTIHDWQLATGNLSYRKAARAIGISHVYLFRVATGLQRPGTGMLIALQKVGIKVELFLTGGK